MNKCPYCGSELFTKVNNIDGGDSFVMMQVSKNALDVKNLMPIQLYGCCDCKGVQIKCDSLKI